MPSFRRALCALLALWLASVDATLVGKPICFNGPSLDVWGYNGYRQLGTSDQRPRYSPTTYTSPDNNPMACIAMGGYHSMAQTTVGTWWAFGRNDFGQLGCGDANAKYGPFQVSDMGGSKVINVSLGVFHSMFLTAAGVIYTAGTGTSGQLGAGTFPSINAVPVAPLFSGSYTVKTIVAGLVSSGAVMTNGSAYAWGFGSSGQLGVGVAATQAVPALVKLSNVAVMCLGYVSSGWLDSAGLGYVAGSWSGGLLGLGANVTTNQLVPTLLTPANGLSVTDFAYGLEHAAYGTTGGWYVFGKNTYGQLGLGNITLSGGILWTPTLLTPPDGSAFNLMSVGQYSSAGSTTGGNYYTWGYNFDGELGLGNTFNQNTPQLLSITQTISKITMGYVQGAVLRTGTYTPTLTMTPTFVVCSASALSFASSSVTINTLGSCTFTLTGSSGSTSWFTRYVSFQLLAIGSKGYVHLRLTNGCPTKSTSNSTTSNTTCTWRLGSGGVGSQTLLTLGSISSVSLSSATVGAEATAQSAVATITGSYIFDPNSPGFTARVSMAYQGTALLLGLTCGLTAVLAVILCCIWLWYQRRRVRRPREDFWNENVRMRSRLLALFIALSMCCILMGAMWIIIATLGASPISLLVGLLIAGAVVAGIGLLIAFACWLWAMRDPIPSQCPECDILISRWRFVGTYLPPEEGSERPFRKAHTPHVRCMVCRKPVVTDRWPASPALRPYHAACWEGHCTKCTTDSVDWSNWWDAQGPEITTEELVHLLAAAVEAGSEDIVGCLLGVDPSLPCLPISQKQGRSAMHLAARLGSLPLLRLLLKVRPYVLDPVCPVGPEAPKSLSINGAEKDENDLYVYQPQLLYNDYPFFVSHMRGKYVYYYKPPTDLSKKAYTEGWCLSAHLGSGAPLYRLPIVEEMNKHHTPSAFPDAAPRGRAQSPVRRALDRVHNWLAGRQQTGSRSNSLEGETMPRPDYDEGATTVHPMEEEVFVAPVRLAADLRLDWVQHAQSLFLEAIASGDRSTIEHVARLYEEQDVSCLWWEYDACYGLWKAFPADQQSAIRDAVLTGAPCVQLATDEERSMLNMLDLRYTISSVANPFDQKVAPFRKRLRSIVQYRDKAKNVFRVTSNIEAVQDWDGAFIIFSPTHAAASAGEDLATLSLLLHERIADHSLWASPTLAGTSVQLQQGQMQEAFATAITDEINSVLGDGVWQAPGSRNRRRSSFSHISNRNVRGETDSGIGNRLTDGLQAPQTNAEISFYPPEYTSNTWTLPFCARLPQNPIGCDFPRESLQKLIVDSIMKVHELRRQSHPHNPRHCVALFVYTYELFSEGGAQDQIYGALNKAMRMRDEKAIAFWRPFIWELDQALQALPPYSGKSYRGINCVMDAKVYATGRRICWPSFSSASKNRSVAEEFAKGTAGTLFFLQSTNAKAITTVSRFPDEEEVLFAPNSTFEITSTMTQASDIGQFYGKVDNIAMKQCGGMYVPGMKPRPVGHTSTLAHVPGNVLAAFIESLQGVQSGGIQALDIVEEREDGISAHVVLSEDPTSPFAPPPSLKGLPRLQDVSLALRLDVDDDDLPDPERVTTPVDENDLFVPMSDLKLQYAPTLAPTEPPTKVALNPDNVKDTDLFALLPPPRPVPKLKPPPKKPKFQQRPKSPQHKAKGSTGINALGKASVKTAMA